MPAPPKTTDAARAAVDERAHFEDHATLCWTRLFHVPIQRVWEAVTSAEQLNLWFMPVWRVDARLGGKCQFGFGRSCGEVDTWEITAFEPPRVVEYSWVSPPGGLGRAPTDAPYRLRFELEQVDAATRFTLKEHTPAAIDARPGFVPGTPWPPGTSAGYHVTLDSAQRFFDANLTPEQIADASADLVAKVLAQGASVALFESNPKGWYDELCGAYYHFIANHCPPREPAG